MSQFAEQLQKEASRPPIAVWYAFVERVPNVATTLCQQTQQKELQHNTTALELASLDIRHGDRNWANFLELLTILRQMDSSQTDEVLTKRRALHELNMFCPMAWIIPKLESRSFATLPPLRNNHGTHNSSEAKLVAIQHFYTALFTPMPLTPLTEEAASTLLSSIQGRISSTTCHLCEAPFTKDELRSVLVQSQEMSAPGLDGISYLLFRILGPPALEKLCRLGNALLRGHHLPDGKPMLRGVLLPKKGDLGVSGRAPETWVWW
ncbi:uncharacterized protein UDID_19658 [Ustilago sp. UG-2017a]|nr:uncharacterized protein UDID_19658 [Ustilago sp. UG-2017a]